MTDPLRYSRLERYPPLGATLARWQSARIAVVGLGGLGGGLAMQLARMGAGSSGSGALVLIDRDNAGPENLGHQALFSQAHARDGMPKTLAAAEVLAGINSSLRIQTHCAELDRRNIRELLRGCSLIFDGLDNYFTRLLLNDYALATRTPYFYAGAVRGELSASAVLPGQAGCLRCLIDRPPPAGSAPTCASEGVFPPLLGVANMLQLWLANEWLTPDLQGEHGKTAREPARLYSLRLPQLSLQSTAITPDPACPACAGRYEYLDGTLDSLAASACSPGRVELQLPTPADLVSVEARLAQGGEFVLSRNAYALSAMRGTLRYTLFAGGRLLLEGSDDPLELSRFAQTYLGL